MTAIEKDDRRARGTRIDWATSAQNGRLKSERHHQLLVEALDACSDIDDYMASNNLATMEEIDWASGLDLLLALRYVRTRLQDVQRAQERYNTAPL